MEHNVAKIEGYKKQFGNVFKYTAEDGKTCLLRKPDLKILDACRTMSGGSSIKFDQALLNNCWLEGDEELRTNDDYMLGLFDHLYSIVKRVNGELEEL